MLAIVVGLVLVSGQQIQAKRIFQWHVHRNPQEGTREGPTAGAEG
jgi:hypothetical protein